jgi:hypothetical protein
LQQQRVQLILFQQLQEARLAQLQNENVAPAGTALGSIGIVTRPVEQPPLTMSKVFRNRAHLRAKTITLTAGQNGEPGILRFSFDAIAACQVTVYRSALLVPALQAAWEIESAAWSSAPKLYPAGLGQVHAVDWEALWHSQAVSGTFESNGMHCPLLVELRVEEADHTPPSVEWTICNLLTTRGNLKTRIEVVKQQFCYGDYQALEMQEVFGSELLADGVTFQDCIICQSEPRDTAVLPCRHMCLCRHCAEILRTRTQYHSYKCPICREKIGRMMRVEPSSEFDDLEVMPAIEKESDIVQAVY